MGPLFMGCGGGESGFLTNEPEMVWTIGVDSVRVRDDSSVGFLDTAADEDFGSVKAGIGAEAKILKEGSDIRGAFQGNRRITMQLTLIGTSQRWYQYIIANDQMSAGCGS
jgi:hypothetical protein